MKYGYARVSTGGQSVEAQVRQLTKAGYKKVFRETASGAKTSRSQVLARAGPSSPPRDGGMAAFAGLMTFLWWFSFPALAPTMFPLGTCVAGEHCGRCYLPRALPKRCAGTATGATAASQRAIGDTMRMLTQLTQIFSAAASPITGAGVFGFALIAVTRHSRVMMTAAGEAASLTAGDAGLRLLGLQRWAI